MDKEKIRASIQTIEYMLTRNDYNKAQEEALTEALEALKIVLVL